MRHDPGAFNAQSEDVRSGAENAVLLDGLPYGVAFAERESHASAALLEAVDGMRPGWTVLQGWSLDPGGVISRERRRRYALLHPRVGVALLDIVPGPVMQDSAERLRRMLDAAECRARFGGLPPVVYLCMPARALPGLGAWLDQQFAQHPPLRLTGGDAWLGLVRQVLAAEGVLAAPASTPPTRRRRRSGVIVIAWLCGVLVVSGAGLALLAPRGAAEDAAFAVTQRWALAGVETMSAALQDIAGRPIDVRPVTEEAATGASETTPHGSPDSNAVPRVPAGEASTAESAALSGPSGMPASAVAGGDAIVLLPEPVSTFPIVIEPPKPALAMEIPDEVLSRPPGSRPAPEAPPMERSPGVVTSPPANIGPTSLPTPEPSMPPPMLRPDAGIGLPTGPALPPPGAIAPVAAEPQVLVPDVPGDGVTPALPALPEGPEKAAVAPGPAAAERSALVPTPAVQEGAPEKPVPSARTGDVLGAPAPAREHPDTAFQTRGAAMLNGRPQSPVPRLAAASGTEPDSAGTPGRPPAPTPSRTGAPPTSLAGEPKPGTADSGLPAAMQLALTRRGDEMIRIGDISAARLFYARAAAGGSGAAALAMARTYDPLVLTMIGARGIPGNVAMAVTWYRQALALGAEEARERLAQLSWSEHETTTLSGRSGEASGPPAHQQGGR